MTDAASLEVLVAALGPIPPLERLGTTKRPIANDVAMVKAAILYADHVCIASPPIGRLGMAAAVSRAAERGETHELARLLQALARADRTTANWAQRDLVELSATYGATLDQLVLDPAWLELRPALEAGLISIEPFPGGNAHDTVAQLLHLMSCGHANQPNCLTVVDKTVARVLQVGEQIGVSLPHPGVPSTEAAFATEVISRIPGFPSSRMDVLLDVRQRLSGPLARFRSAMATYARDIGTLPHGEGFPREVMAVYRERVEPGLLELEEAGRDQKIWVTLRQEVAESSAGRILSATATLALTAAAGLPSAAQATAAIGAAGVDALGAAARRTRQARRTQKQNGLFWLYEMRRITSKSSDRRLPRWPHLPPRRART